MKTFEKRRYQERAVENFGKWIGNDSTLATIILPVGTGKTYTTSLCLEEHGKDRRILWVAHREELIEQAHDALSSVINDRSIAIEMADNRADPNSEIVVGSVQTIARNRKHFQDFIPDLIVIDEYHHYDDGNVQYAGLLKRFPNAKVLGLTATPWRFSGSPLPLGEKLIQMDMGVAIEKGYLVPPKPELLHTDVSLGAVPTRHGDFDLKQLGEVVNVDSRNRLIANRIIELVRSGRQGILFAVDVAHSKAMAELLRGEVRVAEVYGETNKEERRETIRRVRGGEVDVLCNNLCAVEGFDAPHLSFVVLARPTRSLQLYIQTIGRGLRKYIDKTDCILVDVFDKIKVKQSRITFKDMAEVGDLDGSKRQAKSILQAQIPTIANKLVNFPVFLLTSEDRWVVDDEFFSISSWAISDYQRFITWTAEVKTPKTISKEVFVDWEELPPPNIKLEGRKVRHDSFGDGTIKAIAERGDEPKILVEFGWGSRKVMLMRSLKIQKFVEENVLGEETIEKVDRLFYTCVDRDGSPGRLIRFRRQANELFVEEDILHNYAETEAYLTNLATSDGVLPLVKANAKWKYQPASDKQKDFIQKMISKGSLGSDIDATALTKGDASALIEQLKWNQLIIDKFGTKYKEKLLGYDLDSEDV